MLEDEKTHRAHAIVEQVIADLKASAVAHLPSGSFPADMWSRLSRGQDKAAPGSLLGCRFVWPAQG